MSNDVVNVEKWKYGWKTAFLLYSVQVKDTLVFVWQLENVSQLYRLLITTQAVISSSNNVTAWWDFWSVCVYGGCVCYSDNTSFNNTDKHVFTASLLDEPVVRTPWAPLRSHWPWFYAPDQIISIKHMWRKSESAVCSKVRSLTQQMLMSSFVLVPLKLMNTLVTFEGIYSSTAC